MIKAVVFDFDETLAVVGSDRGDLLAQAIGRVDAPEVTREEYLDVHKESLDAESRTAIFQRLYEDHRTDVDPERVATAYRQAVEGSLNLIPGVRSMLDELSESYSIGLLTNGPTDAQWSKIERFRLSDSFDTIYVSGDHNVGKPDPRAFQRICSSLSVDTDQAVYVGDDPETDIRGARGAGMTTVHVVSDTDDRHSSIADATVIRTELPRRLPDTLERLE